MSIYPTRTAVQLTLAGLLAAAAGVVFRVPDLVLWGGSVAVGVAFARAVTLLSVLRIRSAGFEMLWPDARRVVSMSRGETIELRAEVRNRDTLAARYDKLRVIASPALECTIEPRAGEVKATGSVELKVRVRALRAGFHGIHGLALEVRGAPGLFEVPLTFANPYGIEVLPHPSGFALGTAVGGRSQTVTVSGRSSGRRGDGTELRELRDLAPGDSFRRIAWKASARRGKLMTRELEREEHDVVLLVLDASVELWAGAVGEAPLDAAIDAVASLAQHHLVRGDRVGLRIIAARGLADVPVEGGRRQLVAITRALLDHTGVIDADRSGWSEMDVAVQVAEHLRPIDPRGLRDLRRGRLDRLAERAASARRDAPFARPVPAGFTETDAELRRYVASFGLNGPPRAESERERTNMRVSELLSTLTSVKPQRPSVVHVVAPPPLPHAVDSLRTAVRMLRRKGTIVRWSTPPLAGGLTLPPSQSEDAIERADIDEVAEPLPNADTFGALRRATEARAWVTTKKGEALLRSLGVKVSRGARP